MFKQKYIMEVPGKDERLYRFECDHSAPLGEMHDVLFAMKGFILEQIQTKHDTEKFKKDKEKQLALKEECSGECKKEEEKDETKSTA